MIERLEQRRLLTFTPISLFHTIPQRFQSIVGADISSCANGSHLLVTASLGTTSYILRLDLYDAWDNHLAGPPAFYEAAASMASTAAPSCATDADGDSVIAYQTLSDGGRTVNFVFNRVSRGGVVSAPVYVASLTRASADAEPTLTFPVVSMDDAGNFFVGWLESQGCSVVSKKIPVAFCRLQTAANVWQLPEAQVSLHQQHL